MVKVPVHYNAKNCQGKDPLILRQIQPPQQQQHIEPIKLGGE
jgi:hypothetical protein